MKIAIEGAGVLIPNETERTAEALTNLKEKGISNAILGVHPRHMRDAESVIEEFASKHLSALQA